MYKTTRHTGGEGEGGVTNARIATKPAAAVDWRSPIYGVSDSVTGGTSYERYYDRRNRTFLFYFIVLVRTGMQGSHSVSSTVVPAHC